MNASLQSQLTRIETALNTLIESIAAYNPSSQAAVALLEADDDFSAGLEQLSVHQANYARINSLTQAADALSQHLTQSLTLLADTRAELLSTPFTPLPEKKPPSAERREIPYVELLAYAKRISKFTAPPGFRAPVAPTPPVSAPIQAEASTGDVDTTTKKEDSHPSNGTVTNGDSTSKPQTFGANAQKGSNAEGVGLAALPPEEAQWFDRAQNLTFTPWPSADKIRRGGLASIQILSDAGQDPTTTTLSPGPEGGDKLTEDQRRAEREILADGTEAANQSRIRAQTEHERGLETAGVAAEDRAEGNNAPARTAATATEAPPSAAKEEKPAVFGGLDLYDPEDD